MRVRMDPGGIQRFEDLRLPRHRLAQVPDAEWAMALTALIGQVELQSPACRNQPSESSGVTISRAMARAR
jgi:hypothetical protein